MLIRVTDEYMATAIVQGICKVIGDYDLEHQIRLIDTAHEVIHNWNVPDGIDQMLQSDEMKPVESDEEGC